MSFKGLKLTLSGIFNGLSRKDNEIYEKLKAEVEGFLDTTSLNKDLVKLLVISFNETARLGMDESIPVLKTFLSFIRHRLIEGKAFEYKRLLVLLDAYIRNCGFRAQILIGRHKFLNTISETAQNYRTINNTTCQECASLAFDCIQSWSEAFSKYRDYFPYYEDTYLTLKNVLRIQFPRPENDPLRKPIPIDVFLIAEKLKTPMKQCNNDDSDGTASDSSSASGELSPDEQYTMTSTTLSNQAVCYLQDRRSASFWGSPSEVK